MKRIALVSTAVLLAACSSKKDDGVGPLNNDAGSDTAASVVPGSFTLEVPSTDSIESVYGDPGALSADKGAVLKCAKDKDLTKEQLQAAAKDYTGKAFTSGARVYRVLYRTERGDDAKTPGYSSAVVYVPDTPRVAVGSATLLPVIVSSHGTKGQGGECAPSKGDTDAYMNYPLVGSGYVVIAPDLAGYANYGKPNNPPSAYASVSDVGKSTLDAARALRKMFSASVSDKVIIVGHSQGGGTALGALSLSESYGSGGTLAGLVAYAPLWLSQASWGALPVRASDYPLSTSPLVNSVAIWYTYTHGELLDGPGHGGDVFHPAKREAVKNYVATACEPNLDPSALGIDIRDVYDQAFIESVSQAAALGFGCADALCEKWKARFAADRPHFTGAVAQVPILLPYGGKDTTIAPDRMACVLDRLDADKANYKLCFEPEAAHTPVVHMRADYINDWIAARTLGAAEPAACAGQFTRPRCATPPPNEWP